MIEQSQPASDSGPSDLWERTRIFMRRPDLDDLPEPPSLASGYTLRPYAPADRAGLAALLTRAFDELWDDARLGRDLIEAPDVEQTYVVVHEGRVAATASARLLPDEYPGSGYVHWVASDPDQRGKGLGFVVSWRVLQHFRDAGLHDAVLETQDFRLPAVRTYLRLGFVPDYHYGDPDEQQRWSRLLPRLIR